MLIKMNAWYWHCLVFLVNLMMIFIMKWSKKGYADDAGLHNTYVNSILKNYGYSPAYLLVSIQKARIRHVLKAFYEHQVVIASISIKKNLPHLNLSYGYKGVDYTTSETDDSLDDPVLYLWVKDR